MAVIAPHWTQLDLGCAVFQLVLGDLVDLGRAHRDPGLGDLAGNVSLDADVVRGVVAGGVAGEEDRIELVEGELVVGLRVAVRRLALEDRNLQWPPGKAPLDATIMLPIAPPKISPLVSGCFILRER